MYKRDQQAAIHQLTLQPEPVCPEMTIQAMNKKKFPSRLTVDLTEDKFSIKQQCFVWAEFGSPSNQPTQRNDDDDDRPEEWEIKLCTGSESERVI